MVLCYLQDYLIQNHSKDNDIPKEDFVMLKTNSNIQSNRLRNFVRFPEKLKSLNIDD